MWFWQGSEIRGSTGLSAGCAVKTPQKNTCQLTWVSGKRFWDPPAIPFSEGPLTC